MSALSIPAAAPSALLGLYDSQPALPSGVPTGEAARVCGLSHWQLRRLIKQGLIPAPPRNVNGDFVWQAGDIARALRMTDKHKRLGRPRKRAATAAANETRVNSG